MDITEFELAEQERLKKREEHRGEEILAELHGIMAGPGKDESGTVTLAETTITLDDLNENVDENSSIEDYSQSLSDMAASSELFLNEAIPPFAFANVDNETIGTLFDWNFDEISDEDVICNRQDDDELAGNRASRVINGDGNSEIEIKEESETRSETLVQGKKKRGRKRKGAAESRASEGTSRASERTSPVQDLPERYRAHIDRAGGSDIKLIFKKKLTKSDVDTHLARLLMPHSKIPQDFLTETKSVQEGEDMDVNLVDGQLKERSIEFGIWKTAGATYVLKKSWNNVVRENDLEKNDKVQLWSYRVGEELRMALVVLRKSVGNGGENSQI